MESRLRESGQFEVGRQGEREARDQAKGTRGRVRGGGGQAWSSDPAGAVPAAARNEVTR